MTQAGTILPPAALASERDDRVASPGLLLPAISLCKRELVRFLRQRQSHHRGAGDADRLLAADRRGEWEKASHADGLPGGASSSYLQYFFPGTVLMILLFTAIFSTISIIEDRREGFLQSVLVAPGASLRPSCWEKCSAERFSPLDRACFFSLLAPLIGRSFYPPEGFLAACSE
jgi:hypothetical protein